MNGAADEHYRAMAAGVGKMSVADDEPCELLLMPNCIGVSPGNRGPLMRSLQFPSVREAQAYPVPPGHHPVISNRLGYHTRNFGRWEFWSRAA
jgi:hypothetical protein